MILLSYQQRGTLIISRTTWHQIKTTIRSRKVILKMRLFFTE